MGYYYKDLVEKSRLDTETYNLFIPGLGDNMTNREHMWMQVLTDGATDTFYATFNMPGDWIGSGTVFLWGVCVMGAANGNMVNTMETEFGEDGEATNGNNSINNLCVDTDLLMFRRHSNLGGVTLAAGLTKDDFIQASFKRVAGNAGDTLNVDCWGQGFLLYYTRYV